MVFTSLFFGFGIIHAALFVIYVDSSNNSHDAISSGRLIAAAAKVCPKANICSRKRTEFGTISCCEHCSCDEECHEQFNCCFPQYNTYRDLETCLWTSFKTRGIYISPLMYFMTTKCPQNVKPFNPEYNDCENAPVAFWGSLYPIYSQTTRKIYKNHVCAECHGVTDGVLWEVEVDDDCQWFQMDVNESSCNIQFNFKDDKELLRSEHCGITSNRTDFDIPTQLGTIMSKEEIISACHGEFTDHYYDSITYKNVFCAICDSVYGGSDSCPLLNFASSEKFNWIMNEEYSTNSLHLVEALKDRYPQACKPNAIQTHDECRELHCPYRQLYGNNFQCLNVINYWNVDGYKVELRIYLNKPITVHTITEEEELYRWFVSPWPKRWRFQKVFYDEGASFAHLKGTASIIVIMEMNKKMNHKLVLDEIEKCLSRAWYINIDNETLTTYAQFLEYKYIKHMTVNNRNMYENVPDWVSLYSTTSTTNQFKTFNVPPIRNISMKRIYQNKDVRFGTPISVTKIFFCPTIFIKINISYHSAAPFLYNDRLFFSAEYEPIDNEHFNVVICMVDSPYQYVVQSSSNTLYNASIFMVLVIAISVTL